MLPPFPCRDDIRICRNPEGRKCRGGVGGFGVVYKALMNSDEVAVKLVKADKATQKGLSLFNKEVRLLTPWAKDAFFGRLLVVATTHARRPASTPHKTIQACCKEEKKHSIGHIHNWPKLFLLL